MAKGAELDKARLRIARFLSPGSAGVADAAASGNVLLDAGDRGTISVARTLLAKMAQDGFVTLKDGRVALSGTAIASGKRASETPTGFQDQHRDLDTIVVDVGAGPDTATVNWSESPLGQLMRRKTRDGTPFLSAAEFQAGERLRADYTRGQIMPRLSANWVASVSSGRRDGGVADLTDAALAARQRVERAISAVGPELSGILIDVCCFLKGMETVEVERGWPVRSAKIVLKTALGALSRHYDPALSRQGRRQTLHWGASDYRPSI